MLEGAGNTCAELHVALLVIKSIDSTHLEGKHSGTNRENLLASIHTGLGGEGTVLGPTISFLL